MNAETWRGCGAPRQIAVLTVWCLRTLVSDRRVVVFSVLQPLIMLVLFTQVFGAVANPANFPPGVSYVDYLLPAVLVTTGIGPAVAAGASLVREMDRGALTRFRAMPLGLHWVLLARSLSDMSRVGVQSVVLLASGALLFGFTAHGGVLGSVAALLVALLVIWTLMWIFIAFAAWLRSPEIMQSIGFVLVFPLMFASSAFVPVANLPGWLQVVATVNPMTYAVNAARHLSMGEPVGTSVLLAITTSVGLLAVAGFLAARGFRRPLTR
ncbi:ABC transporter permease [Goodfellowiella coeruleoviolacea]|uniref:Transport permease protein n=1 Tax=Goodfellowiella coeruleoviolacea TaxID=334858 RepID=A0AAE3GL55_9PSEU|nr:ABC transporter permease [Goodfellowiella coeruleoviolacea]MCP2170065.1 ABC-2 type transport system permease protein [Goodfellowiella coeruleoviolacea]